MNLKGMENKGGKEEDNNREKREEKKIVRCYFTKNTHKHSEKKGKSPYGEKSENFFGN